MKISIFSTSLIALVLASACNTQTPKENDHPASKNEITFDLRKGFNLAENYCFSCHSPNATLMSRIAPPMMAIKKHYINNITTEQEFAANIIHFLNNPSEEISKMPGAIAKFNLMPKMSFSEENLMQIAHYIYNTDIAETDWFENHYQQEKKKYDNQAQHQSLSYTEQGLQYAMATKAILGKNLIGAINEKGTAEAMSFCNTKAIHLTDSMAQNQGVAISRVSDQERNSNNKANAEELAYIKASKAKIRAGKKPSPQIVELANMVVGYYPIITNAMCLQCHGNIGTNIGATTLAKLNTLYPNDQARGYGLDELRGIWVIEMSK
jgi:cytochrome c553